MKNGEELEGRQRKKELWRSPFIMDYLLLKHLPWWAIFPFLPKNLCAISSIAQNFHNFEKSSSCFNALSLFVSNSYQRQIRYMLGKTVLVEFFSNWKVFELLPRLDSNLKFEFSNIVNDRILFSCNTCGPHGTPQLGIHAQGGSHPCVSPYFLNSFFLFFSCLTPLESLFIWVPSRD